MGRTVVLATRRVLRRFFCFVVSYRFLLLDAYFYRRVSLSTVPFEIVRISFDKVPPLGRSVALPGFGRSALGIVNGGLTALSLGAGLDGWGGRRDG